MRAAAARREVQQLSPFSETTTPSQKFSDNLSQSEFQENTYSGSGRESSELALFTLLRRLTIPAAAAIDPKIRRLFSQIAFLPQQLTENSIPGEFRPPISATGGLKGLENKVFLSLLRAPNPEQYSSSTNSCCRRPRIGFRYQTLRLTTKQITFTLSVFREITCAVGKMSRLRRCCCCCSCGQLNTPHRNLTSAWIHTVNK